jgi:hypothetical protein
MGWFEGYEVFVYWFCNGGVFGRECCDVAFDVE